jgi:hypothetical protein
VWPPIWHLVKEISQQQVSRVCAATTKASAAADPNIAALPFLAPQINIIISQAVGASAEAAPSIVTSLSSWSQSLALQTIITVSGLKLAQAGVPQVVDLITATTATAAAGTPLISSAGLLQEILVATTSAAAAAVSGSSNSSSSSGVEQKDANNAVVIGIAVAAALAVVSVSAAAAVIVVVKQRTRAAAARADGDQGLSKRVSLLSTLLCLITTLQRPKGGYNRATCQPRTSLPK